MKSLFDDLFAFGRGLCHLRIYGEAVDASLVVLAINLADNPGASVVNAPEALQQRIAKAFSPSFRLFSIFPEYGDAWTEVIPAVDGDRSTFRREVAQAEIERLVGVTVGVPAPEECRAADLGGEDHPLLALISAEEEEPGVLSEMQVVAVADLPWAHLPSKCAHFQDFEAIRTLYDESREGEVPAGAHFFLNLDSERLAACPYHQHDWKAIAAASVEMLAQLAPESDHDDVLREASRLLPEGPDRRELTFLFSDPIIWSPGAEAVTNGQHRTCALKAADAPECVVVTGRAFYGEVRPGNPRRRAESALATHWARRLGSES